MNAIPDNTISLPTDNPCAVDVVTVVRPVIDVYPTFVMSLGT